MATMLKKYGAGAFKEQKSRPIGGGVMEYSEYSESSAHYHPENSHDLALQMGDVKSDQLIWIPDGVTIQISEHFGKSMVGGAILAAGRGVSANPGKIKSSYNPTSYMTGLITGRSYNKMYGLTIEGPGGLGAVGSCGPCAIRGDGQKGMDIFNVEVSQFPGAGIWFGDGNPGITRWNDDAQRNRVRNAYIHHIQRHGFGYGIGEQGGSQSFLAEACRIEFCRHPIMAQAGSDSYEVRYCEFGEAVYNTKTDGTGKWYQSHQVDCHGSGADGKNKAGAHLIIIYNTFSVNTTYQVKPHVMVRGIPGVECIVMYNWSKKSAHSGLFSETASTNSAFTLAGGAGGVWNGGPNLADYHMTVKDNWYGVTAPPDVEGEDPEPPQPPDETEANLDVVGLSTAYSEESKVFAVNIDLKNFGDAKGQVKVVMDNEQAKTLDLDPDAEGNVSLRLEF